MCAQLFIKLDDCATKLGASVRDYELWRLLPGPTRQLQVQIEICCRPQYQRYWASSIILHYPVYSTSIIQSLHPSTQITLILFVLITDELLGLAGAGPGRTFHIPLSPCHSAILPSWHPAAFRGKGANPLWCSRESTPLISFCNLHLANKGVNAVADRNDSLLCSSPRAKCFPASQPVSQLASHLAAGQDNTSQSVYISMDKSFGSSSPRKTHATHC